MKNPNLLSLETIRFVRNAIDESVDLQSLLQDPNNAALRLGIELPLDSIKELKSLKENYSKISSKLPSPQIILILNQIMLDGRFINSWKKDIEEMSTQLGIDLTPSLREELYSADIESLFLDNVDDSPQASVATTAAGVVAAVVVGAAVAHINAEDESPILDFSNVPKF